MKKNDVLFKIFSQNLRKNFARFRLKLTYLGEDVDEQLYVCPITLKCYSVTGMKRRELTIEHVPPEKLGGKGIILTCKEANNTDGHTSDKKLLNFFKNENFKKGLGKLDVKISSEQLGFNGVTGQFAISKKGVEPLLEIVSSTKNIEVLNFKGLFKNWDGGQFNLKWHQQTKIDKRALLKTAYLIAFSKIGYELLLDNTGFKMNTYGRLIKYLRSEQTQEDFPVVFFEAHAPLVNSEIGVVITPLEYKALFVNLSFKLSNEFYRYVVFLPHPDSFDLSPLRLLKEGIASQQSIDFQFSEIKMDISC